MNYRTAPASTRAIVRGVFFAILLVTLSARLASSSTIYTDLGPGDTYSTASYLTVSGGLSPGPYHYDWAMAFTASGDYTLDAIRLAVGLVSGTPGDLNVAFAAAGGGLPGSILEAWTLSSIGSINGPLTTATSALHPLLSVGATYWVLVDAPVASSAVFQWNASLSAWGFHAMRYNEGSWSNSSETPFAAFDVEGSPSVPEPATLVLLGSGAAALAWHRRRSSRLPNA